MAKNNIWTTIVKNFSISYLLILFLVLFMLWASLFEINKSVRTTGVIVSHSSNQVVQIADGGILSQILVKEGEKVKKGQLLATLGRQRILANYEQIKTDIAYLNTSLIRVDALIFNKDIAFNNQTEITRSQEVLYNQQKQSFNDKVSLLKQRLNIAENQLQLNNKLFTTGDISELEILQLEEKVIDIKEKILDTTNSYYEELKKEKEQLEANLIKNKHKLKEQEDILRHSNIYSPVAGVIKDIKVKTLGGVLGTGDTLLEISPGSDDIILEAKVFSQDIADIYIGNDVLIKLDAFDFTIFGSLNGKVDYISSDTLLEQDESGRQQSFYKVNILITEKHNTIIPKLGMSGAVEIITGKRSLFTYLVKPIKRAFDGALIER
jgi:adhesin transport system membrane fusion protein